MAQPSVKTFRLKKGSDVRSRGGHPWIYSNEIQGSPKGEPNAHGAIESPVAAGEIVKLTDAGGKFQAWGYANPHSLIFFRVLSRQERFDPVSGLRDLLHARLSEAWRIRESLGLATGSFRWVFGEGDFLPGLILDRYLGPKDESVVVLQAHTVGIDRLIPLLAEIIPSVAGKDVALVIRNDLSVRKLEGVPVEPVKIHSNPRALDLARFQILVRGAGGSAVRDSATFNVDLIGGQKTGFFLDQSENVSQVIHALGPRYLGTKKIRILDLCTYVGQWSTKLALAFRARGIAVETVLVDASDSALALAETNALRAGAEVETLKADVLQGFRGLEAGSFDLVISDPPALIKGRKDLPQGAAAYLKLNTEAFRLVRSGGVVVACSCSQLLEEADFFRGLAKAAFRNQKAVRVIARGTQAIDHPLRLEFPEGKYLKMIVGLVTDADTAEAGKENDDEKDN